MSGKLQQVHVRVNDAATGKPTPCWIRFLDDDGNYFAPLGRSSRIPHAFADSYRDVAGCGPFPCAYIDGACEIELPAGRLLVEVGKGPEYERLRQDVLLAAGKLALRFELTRLLDPRASGWHPGAMITTSLSPHDVAFEAAAEGLQVVDLLAYERETTIDGREHWSFRKMGPHAPLDSLLDYPNLLAFSGQRPCLDMHGCLVAVNTCNRHWALGELALLHCHRAVFPLRFGLSGYEHSTYHRPDNWTLGDWCDQCHRKRGLVVGFDISWSKREADGWYGGEGLADIILRKIDAVGYGKHQVGTGDWWYTLLSLGLRVPIVAGWRLRPVGLDRTYVCVAKDEEFTYASWIEGIRAGRTVVSAWPLLSLSVNGQDVGATIEVDRRSRVVQVVAEAAARDAFAELQIIHDGAIVAALPCRADGVFRATLQTERPILRSGWLAARCTAEGSPTPIVVAHTSPVYLHVPDQPPAVDAAGVRDIASALDRTLAWVQLSANCPKPQDRERLANVFAEAKQAVQSRRDS